MSIWRTIGAEPVLQTRVTPMKKVTTETVRIATFCHPSVDIPAYLALVQVSKHGMWELPGGKISLGETPKEAAVRELFEETSLSGQTLRLSLKQQYPSTTRPGESVVWHVYTTFIINPILPKLYPSDPEEIIDTRWIRHDDLPRVRKHLEPKTAAWIDAHESLLLQKYPVQQKC